MTIRAIGKALAYDTGAIRAFHSIRNSNTLTVLMFHRVLPKAELLFQEADGLYTVTPQFLIDCIAFVRDHYNIVSLDDVIRSQTGKTPLPSKALLITFDDGWYDNLEFASPSLGNIPWTLFAAADAMLEPDCWWQEALQWATRSGATSLEALWRASDIDHSACQETNVTDGSYSLLLRYSALALERRDLILAPYSTMLRKKLCGRPMMLAPQDLVTLKLTGATIGAHGASHVPLSLLPDAESDMIRSRELLTQWIGNVGPVAMSFPHGRYDRQTIETARKLHYGLLFTSDPVLNRCTDGWIEGDLLGRIPISMKDMAGESGRLVQHKLAAWLFLREISALSETR